MANVPLAAGGRGAFSTGDGGSDGGLTNWDGTKKKTDWGISQLSPYSNLSKVQILHFGEIPRFEVLVNLTVGHPLMGEFQDNGRNRFGTVDLV